MQIQTISKSQFKPKALEYFRLVEKEKKSLLITHNRKPIAKIIPYSKKRTKKSDEEILKELRNSVVSYGDILSPVGVEDWEAPK